MEVSIKKSTQLLSLLGHAHHTVTVRKLGLLLHNYIKIVIQVSTESERFTEFQPIAKSPNPAP